MDAQRSDVIFDALGHGTRRDILTLLQDGPLAVGEIAQHLPVSRPAVSKHLRILSDADLVVHAPSGNRNVFRLSQDGFAAGRAYLEEFWTIALNNFERLVATKTKRRD